MSVRSGIWSVMVDGTRGNGTLQAVGAPRMTIAIDSPSVYLDGQRYQVGAGMQIVSATTSTGTDLFGPYHAATLSCVAGPRQVPVVYSVRAYTAPSTTTINGHTGIAGVHPSLMAPVPPNWSQLQFDVAFPEGANGTQIQPPPAPDDGDGMQSPEQISGFPSFRVEDALEQAGFACYRQDKVHIKIGANVSTIDDCATLTGGPTILFWPSSSFPSSANDTSGLAAAVFSSANNFKLNFQRVFAFYAISLFYNPGRRDYVFCAADGCSQSQIGSGYTVLSEEGLAPPSGHTTIPLYFWWSPSRQARSHSWGQRTGI